MKASRIILLLVALLAGGLAAFLATRGDAPQQVMVEGPTQIVEEKKTKILVAKAPIGVGQRLSSSTIEWQPWPELAVRAEYISETALPDALTQMTDAIARFEIFPGEPITPEKLVRSDQGYLSAVLPKGMRGVSVPVNADTAAGGFIMPNDRVDVVLSRGGGSGTISETILSNVKVLAIGTRLGEVNQTEDSGDGEKKGDPRDNVFQAGTIATLELTPQQGETIINSTRLGLLTLVLRSIADYAQTPAEMQRNETSRAIRMIRFGRNLDVMPSNPGVEITGAGYDEPTGEGTSESDSEGSE